MLIMVVLLVSGISDTKASIADMSIPDNETANFDSASATITITWTIVGLPDE